jgi:hypothetical protein
VDLLQLWCKWCMGDRGVMGERYMAGLSKGGLSFGGVKPRFTTVICNLAENYTQGA